MGHARRAHRGVAGVFGAARTRRRGGGFGGARARRVARLRFVVSVSRVLHECDSRRDVSANLPKGRRRGRALELPRVRRGARAPRRRRRRRRNRRAPAFVRRAGPARRRRRDVVRGDQDPRGSCAAPGDARVARRSVDGGAGASEAPEGRLGGRAEDARFRTRTRTRNPRAVRRAAARVRRARAPRGGARRGVRGDGPGAWPRAFPGTACGDERGGGGRRTRGRARPRRRVCRVFRRRGVHG